MEGDIFEKCSVSSIALKRVILEEISSLELKLEAHNILNKFEKIVSEVPDALA